MGLAGTRLRPGPKLSFPHSFTTKKRAGFPPLLRATKKEEGSA